MWVPRAALVSYGVLNYPMGALIELDTLLIVSLDEGEIGVRKKGEHGRAAKQGREGTATSAESTGTRVSGADICTQLDLNFALN